MTTITGKLELYGETTYQMQDGSERVAGNVGLNGESIELTQVEMPSGAETTGQMLEIAFDKPSEEVTVAGIEPTNEEYELQLDVAAILQTTDQLVSDMAASPADASPVEIVVVADEPVFAWDQVNQVVDTQHDIMAIA